MKFSISSNLPRLTGGAIKNGDFDDYAVEIFLF